MGQLGVLYHVGNGSYVQPVEGGTDYLVNYTDGQLYGLCDDDQIATPAQLALRGLVFLPVAGGFNPTTQRWNSTTKAVEAIPAKPKALIVCKHPNGSPDTNFDVDEIITLEIEIRTPDGSARLTSFSGVFRPQVIGPQRDRIPLKFTFTEGLASRTVVFKAAGIYTVDSRSSELVDLPAVAITVAL